MYKSESRFSVTSDVNPIFTELYSLLKGKRKGWGRKKNREKNFQTCKNIFIHMNNNSNKKTCFPRYVYGVCYKIILIAVLRSRASLDASCLMV